MVYRTFALGLGALALALAAGAATLADEKKPPDDVKTSERGERDDHHEGTVIRASAGRLVMKAKARDGVETAAEYTYTLAPGAEVTCDGRACKLADLRGGQRVRVTAREGNRTAATRVEALQKNANFEPRERKRPEGKNDEPGGR